MVWKTTRNWTWCLVVVCLLPNYILSCSLFFPFFPFFSCVVILIRFSSHQATGISFRPLIAPIIIILFYGARLGRLRHVSPYISFSCIQALQKRRPFATLAPSFFWDSGLASLFSVYRRYSDWCINDIDADASSRFWWVPVTSGESWPVLASLDELWLPVSNCHSHPVFVIQSLSDWARGSDVECWPGQQIAWR
jgi:hypothetical protein